MGKVIIHKKMITYKLLIIFLYLNTVFSLFH